MATQHPQPEPDAVGSLLREIDSLPTLSPVALRIVEVSGRDDAGLAEIAGLIEPDPALTARVLGLCARADKGVAGRISTVRQGVVMLGMDAVRGAVLSVCAYEVFDRAPAGAGNERALSGPRLDRPGFWQHAIAVACASELIASASPRLGILPGDAFVAGLLHDLGKLVLDLLTPGAYARALSAAEAQGASVAAFERAETGLDHHIAGRRLAEHWSIPEPLCHVMWLHGLPPGAVPPSPHRPLIGLVSAAKALCRELHLGWSGEFDPPASFEPLAGAWGVDARAVRLEAHRLPEAVASRCRALGVFEATVPELMLASVASANRALGRLALDLDRQRTLARESEALAAKRRDQAERLADALASSLRELSEAQSRLAEAQAMARLGEFAAGAAHEMNNPLAVISGRGQMLAARLAGTPDGADALAIARASGRLSELISSLHTLSAAPTPAPAWIDPLEPVWAAAGRAETRTGNPGRIRIPGSSGAQAFLDPDLACAALAELLANALEASPDGFVEVRVEPAPVIGRLNGRMWRFTVTDQGPGMSSKALTHAFDPFFSEKPAGRATGLGLTRARRFAGAMGGSLTLASEPGRGTTATLSLPDLTAPAQEAAA